ncbi:MAG: hypothetical protein ACREQF_00425, partial [Candidatus Binataceae bacterium]
MERMTGWGPDGVQTQREASCLAFALTWIVTAALLTVAALHHDLQNGGFLADINLPVRVAKPTSAIAVVRAREAWAAEEQLAATTNVANAHRFAARHGAAAQSPSLAIVTDVADADFSPEHKAATVAQRLETMGERDLARLAMLVALMHPAAQHSH